MYVNEWIFIISLAYLYVNVTDRSKKCVICLRAYVNAHVKKRC